MSYARPIGMMGLGMGPSGVAPPFRKYGFRSFDGLGALGGADTPTPLSVTVVQRGLHVAKADGRTDLSPGTIDGVYGPATARALRGLARTMPVTEHSQEFLAAFASGPMTGSPTTRNRVIMPNDVASLLERLSGRCSSTAACRNALPGASSPSTTSTPATDPSTPMPSGDGVIAPDGTANVEEWLPWAIGGGVLVLVGGYFVWRGQKKGGMQRRPVAANRRRRRSSRRRR
jgi:hypothetical protein